MIKFACPGCSAVFSVGDEKAGKTGKCPKCQSQFVIPEAEATPPTAPAPVSDTADIEIKPCPGCKATLTVAKSDLGLDVECPYCKTVYKATKPGGTATAATVDDRPSRRPRDDDENRPKRRSPRDEDEDEDDEDDDRPRRKNRRDDDDEAEDDRPRRRSRRDDDKDYDDRPRRRRSSRGSRAEAQAAVNGPAIFLLVLGILALVYAVVNVVFSLVGFGPRAAAIQQQNAMGPIAMVVGMILPFLWGAVVTLAGFKMKSLSSRGSVMFGTIFALLPCSPCCLLGIPAGIWGLVVLSREDVKRAFDS